MTGFTVYASTTCIWLILTKHLKVHNKMMAISLQALLRQKIQEIKRLEIALQNEQHLRSELELDLEDRGNTMKDKGNYTFIF